MKPWIDFKSILPSGDDDELSKFVLQASFDGRLKSDEGSLSAIGDLATLTALSGKDLYVTAAKVVFHINTFTGPPQALGDIVELKINGVVVETTPFTIDFTNTLGTFAYEFKNMGHKVTATQTMKLEVTALDAETDVEGFIQAIEVPTDANPVIYTGP